METTNSHLDILERLLKFLGRAALLLSTGIILSIIWSAIAHAESIDDIFMVPLVNLTPSGAAVLQPQTGDGYKASQNKSTIVRSGNIVEAGKTSSFSSGSSYVPPKYDAFADGSANMAVSTPVNIVKNVEAVDFSIYNNQPGSRDKQAGTTRTTFTFKGKATSKYFSSSEMEYRWDFENDGEMDSYFSRVSSISHKFTNPGQYDVKMEVLDGSGQVHSVVKRIVIVENTPPRALFKVDKIVAPENSLFRFETYLSEDDQYSKNYLSYRFDWNGDGTFDTNSQNKSVWNHLFRDPGSYKVIMEATDPEGATDQTYLTIDILEDSPPKAKFSVEKISDFRYKFDAGSSTDDYSPSRSLRYRWDFNYTGSNDIIFDTGWSSSPKFTGNYKIGGTKMIRLQVKDEQGFIDETFAKITVPWPEEYLNIAVGAIAG